MIEKIIAFSVPGGNSPTITPIEVPPVPGMPTGGTDIVTTAIHWGLTVVFVVASIVALLFIIWGGISWITSGGEKGGLLHFKGEGQPEEVALLLEREDEGKRIGDVILFYPDMQSDPRIPNFGARSGQIMEFFLEKIKLISRF